MAPDKSIPKDLLQNAHAIAVIPDVIKAGFVVGGRHGDWADLGEDARRHLVQSELRRPHRRQRRLPGRRFVDRRRARVPHAARRRFDRAWQVHARRGCVGSGGSGRPLGDGVDRCAAQGRDLFVLALTRPFRRRGARRLGAITIDNDANQAVYGEGVTPRRIFEGGVTGVPNPVVDFRDRLEEYTSERADRRRANLGRRMVSGSAYTAYAAVARMRVRSPRTRQLEAASQEDRGHG